MNDEEERELVVVGWLVGWLVSSNPGRKQTNKPPAPENVKHEGNLKEAAKANGKRQMAKDERRRAQLKARNIRVYDGTAICTRTQLVENEATRAGNRN